MDMCTQGNLISATCSERHTLVSAHMVPWRFHLNSCRTELMVATRLVRVSGLLLPEVKVPGIIYRENIQKKKNRTNKENSVKLLKEFDIKKSIIFLYTRNNQLERQKKTSFTIAINFKALRNKSNKRYVRPLWRKITKYY